MHGVRWHYFRSADEDLFRGLDANTNLTALDASDVHDDVVVDVE